MSKIDCSMELDDKEMEEMFRIYINKYNIALGNTIVKDSVHMEFIDSKTLNVSFQEEV